jgi:hypothetical protein
MPYCLVEPQVCREKNLCLVFGAPHDTENCVWVFFPVPPEGVKNREQIFLFSFFSEVRTIDKNVEKPQKEKKIDGI